MAEIAAIAEDAGKPEERDPEEEDAERPEELATKVTVLAEGKQVELNPKVFDRIPKTPTLRDKSIKTKKIFSSTLLEKPKKTKYWKRETDRDSP